MATVTGFTAEYMQEILDGTIASAELVGDNLVFTKIDASTLDVGSVRGTTGATGATGPAASWAGYDEPYTDLGNSSGTVTINCNTYNTWKMTPTGAITIAFSNLPAAGYTTPLTIIFANSTYAISWPGGTKFSNGTAPVLSGETWIAAVAFPTYVSVGLAWAGVA